MKKWMKNNKGILIMGAFFVVGTSVTAALVCSVPNFVVTSIEVKEVKTNPPYKLIATAGKKDESPGIFLAESSGHSQRGGKAHIFYNWSLERDKNDNAKLPSWLSIEPVYDNKGHTTNLAKLVWTDKCEVETQQYHLYAIASHLGINGKLSSSVQLTVKAA